MWKIFQGNNMNDTAETYQALVKAFFPTEKGSVIENMGNYMSWVLDHTVSIQLGLSPMTIPLSYATAELLDTGARQLIAEDKASDRQKLFSNGGSFWKSFT
jgi:hypothetical protein